MRRAGESGFTAARIWRSIVAGSAVAQLEHAPRLLAYKGERDMAVKAAEMLAGDPL
jgi:hypothetical protein